LLAAKKGNSSKVELHLILITYIAWFRVIPKVQNPPHTHMHSRRNNTHEGWGHHHH
jgi:hypothetical protein